MKANEIYQGYKDQLRAFANEIQTSDRPMRRADLNDYTDYLVKEMGNYDYLKERISEKQYNQFSDWLVLYTIKRHTK